MESRLGFVRDIEERKTALTQSIVEILSGEFAGLRKLLSHNNGR